MSAPGHDRASGEGDRRAIDAFRQAGPEGPTIIRHYLYFRSARGARRAGRELEGQGYAVKVGPSAQPGSGHLVLATHTATVTEEVVEHLRERLEEVARRLGGEYDGWEAATGR